MSMQDDFDITRCSTAAEIRSSLAQLHQREQAVTSKLDLLLESQKDLARQLNRLDLARTQLTPQVSTIRSISNGMLTPAASTASRIYNAVKLLDNEQAAVKATLEIVKQVAELKTCVLGVHASMGAPQDWETAATYLSRASKVPEVIRTSPFAEEMVPTAEVPGSPSATLNEAAESLCLLFLREFDKAATAGDGARVTRFFKLFPLIARDQVGLDAYGRYVCGGVASRARDNFSAANKQDDVAYVLALTKLFEHVAQIVDGHEPIVTRHYGAGTMAKVVARLQVEADIQGGLLLDTWAGQVQLARKITQVRSHAFSFLVQSFLQQKPVARNGSPGLKAAQSPVIEEDQGLDLKVVDALSSRMASMLSRWSLYTRFIATKLTTDSLSSKPSPLVMPALLAHSNLYRKVTDLLIDPFNTMCTFAVRRSIEKSFEIDEVPANLNLSINKPLGSNGPFITSVVDDAMYIVNQILQRALGTCQYAVVANVIPSIARVLGSDFYGMIQRKMRDESYPKAVAAGTLPPEQTVISFIVLTNNLDVATDYVRRIVQSSLARQDASKSSSEVSSVLVDAFPFENEASEVDHLLQNLLDGFSSKTNDLITEAVSVLLKQVIRPRLRPVMTDTFKDMDYLSPSADQRSGHDTSYEDAIVQRFERGWNAIMLPIKRIATEKVHTLLQRGTIQHLSKLLEKRIWSYHDKVNEFGAVKLERDLMGIIQIAVQGGPYELRDDFGRCTQMLLILNMDDDEWLEMASTSGADTGQAIDWKLDVGERQRARAIVKRRAG